MKLYKAFWKMFAGLLCLVLLSTTAFANDYDFSRTNAYITRTRATIDVLGDGELSIGFNISGKGKMDEIGATTIYLYENNGRTTRVAQTFRHTDPGYTYLMGTDSYYHSGNVSYEGTPGYTYYAVVEFRAGNSSGSDSTSYTTSTVTA